MSLFGVGVTEVLLVLIVAFLILGPKRLPGVAVQLGKSVRSVKQFIRGITGQFSRELQDLTREYETLTREVQELRQQVDDRHPDTSASDQVQQDGKAGLSHSTITEPISEDLPREHER